MAKHAAKAASGSEVAMYKPLVDFMTTQLGCEYVRHAAQTPRISLSVPDPNSRIPDVAGAHETAAGWKTILVEAKRDKGSATAIHQALGQLQAISSWADSLFLALQAEDWNRRSDTSRRSVERELRERGFGLLLVDDGDVTERR